MGDGCITALIIGMLLIVGVVAKEIWRALRRAQLPPREPFSDAVLGRFEPCEDGWIAKIVRGEDSFELQVSGACEPDAAVVAHAREIVNDFSSFKKRVVDRMELESRDYPPDGKAELARLEIDLISLSAPGEGMIFFRGSPTDVGAWRFNYIGGEATGLGCDT